MVFVASYAFSIEWEGKHEWQEPSDIPPADIVGAPIHNGFYPQAKAGPLMVNAGGAQVGFMVATGSVGIGMWSGEYDSDGKRVLKDPSDILDVHGSITAGGVLNDEGEIGMFMVEAKKFPDYRIDEMDYDSDHLAQEAYETKCPGFLTVQSSTDSRSGSSYSLEIDAVVGSSVSCELIHDFKNSAQQRIAIDLSNYKKIKFWSKVNGIGPDLRPYRIELFNGYIHPITKQAVTRLANECWDRDKKQFFVCTAADNTLKVEPVFGDTSWEPIKWNISSVPGELKSSIVLMKITMVAISVPIPQKVIIIDDMFAEAVPDEGSRIEFSRKTQGYWHTKDVIDGNGRFGIGLKYPSSALEIYSKDSSHINIAGEDGQIRINDQFGKIGQILVSNGNNPPSWKNIVNCPAGFVDTSLGYCVQTKENTSDWFGAASLCKDLNARLCSASEWYNACISNLALFNKMDDNAEWVDDKSYEPAAAIADLYNFTLGDGGCNKVGKKKTSELVSYRCCRSNF